MISQKTQTIVQKLSSLQYYDFEYLDNHTLTAFRNSLNQPNFSNHQRKISRSIFKMLECYLQITNQTFTLSNTLALKNQRIVTLFIGALWSNKFVQKNIEKKCEWIRIFIKILNSSELTQYLSAHWVDTTPSAIKKYFDPYAKQFEEMELLAIIVWIPSYNTVIYVVSDAEWQQPGHDSTDDLIDQIISILMQSHSWQQYRETHEMPILDDASQTVLPLKFPTKDGLKIQ